jgi:hypothetical protein
LGAEFSIKIDLNRESSQDFFERQNDHGAAYQGQLAAILYGYSVSGSGTFDMPSQKSGSSGSAG